MQPTHKSINKSKDDGEANSNCFENKLLLQMYSKLCNTFFDVHIVMLVYEHQIRWSDTNLNIY